MGTAGIATPPRLPRRQRSQARGGKDTGEDGSGTLKRGRTDSTSLASCKRKKTVAGHLRGDRDTSLGSSTIVVPSAMTLARSATP